MRAIRTAATIVFLLLALTFTHADNKGKYCSVVFYNLENLFDTIHDEGKNDYEFLPKGKNSWDSRKYKSKINNIATVLSEIDNGNAALIGVCEVENAGVLKELLSNRRLIGKGLKYIHRESSDSRGVDCALIYDSRRFVPQNSQLVPYSDTITRHRTRGYLVVSGKLLDEDVHVIVNHWPSRYSKSPSREYAAKRVKRLKDSIAAVCPQSKIIIMGDFNDNPDNKSLKVCLEARRNISEISSDSALYNPWWDVLRRDKQGSIKYRDRWQLYDQIIVSGNLCGRGKGLQYEKCEIHCRRYMMNSEGNYAGYPKRTIAGGRWINGYSDHLPVVIYLRKEQKKASPGACLYN